jgi:putative DNA methylase
MKAAIEYPLKFGPDLQVDIDKWVKWVGDEAKVRLAEFFPSHDGESIQNYFWVHTVICPNCKSITPLSPNWWLYNRPEKQNSNKWVAIKPIPDPKNKQVNFEIVKGKKGKGTTIQTEDGEFEPEVLSTFSRGVGKCTNCGNLIEDETIKAQGGSSGLGHQLYAIAYRLGKNSLEFRVPNLQDIDAIEKAEK